MIKYLELDGYKGLGEISHHLYQWIEDPAKVPKIILVSAYTDEPVMFKGYVFHQTKNYESVDFTADEITKIERLAGTMTILTDFNEFLNKAMGIQKIKYERMIK